MSSEACFCWQYWNLATFSETQTNLPKTIFSCINGNISVLYCIDSRRWFFQDVYKIWYYFALKFFHLWSNLSLTRVVTKTKAARLTLLCTRKRLAIPNPCPGNYYVLCLEKKLQETEHITFHPWNNGRHFWHKNIFDVKFLNKHQALPKLGKNFNRQIQKVLTASSISLSESIYSSFAFFENGS